MEKRDIPRPGEFYRHFKNRLYQIVAVACDAETQEPFVVYQALYGDYRVWIRPLENFLSRTDREKYPDVKQEWRFERVTMAQGAGASAPGTGAPVTAGSVSAASAPGIGTPAASVLADRDPAGDVSDGTAVAEQESVLLKFLDADSLQEKKAILMSNLGHLTQRDLDSICMAMDIPSSEGDIRSQAMGIISFMKTRERYESDRMREGRDQLRCSIYRKN